MRQFLMIRFKVVQRKRERKEREREREREREVKQNQLTENVFHSEFVHQKKKTVNKLLAETLRKEQHYNKLSLLD